MPNTCTRCDKLRKISKTWKGVVTIHGRSTTITHTEYVCTDPDCQKIVESLLLTQREKKEAIDKQKAQDKQAKDKERAERLLQAKLAIS